MKARTNGAVALYMTPNKRTVESYMDEFRKTDRPQILYCLTDDVEEGDVVVAEGSVRAPKQDGGFLNLVL
jgi:hypothetical protein